MNVAQRQEAELLMLIIEDMGKQGFHVQMGQHATGWGYWAMFWQPSNLQCWACLQSIIPNWWDDCGHASDLIDAVTEARELALGLRRRPALPPKFFGHK